MEQAARGRQRQNTPMIHTSVVMLLEAGFDGGHMTSGNAIVAEAVAAASGKICLRLSHPRRIAPGSSTIPCQAGRVQPQRWPRRAIPWPGVPEGCGPLTLRTTPAACGVGWENFSTRHLLSLRSCVYCYNVWLPQGTIGIERRTGAVVSLAVPLSIYARQEISGRVRTVFLLSLASRGTCRALETLPPLAMMALSSVVTIAL